MQSLEREVLLTSLQWLRRGEQPWLCTIVKTIGSSPRPVGSLLACLDAGEQVGSISGGCVEEDLLARIRAGEFSGRRPEHIEYGVKAEDNERLGLPCGGRMELLLQRLQARDEDWLQGVIEALAARQCVRRDVSLVDGTTQLRARTEYQPLAYDATELRQTFGPHHRMLLVGCGQLAQSLAELALAMDYQVMITDPRKPALAQWQGPEVPLLAGMPDDAVRSHASDRFSLVITLTHDPRIDDMALMEALGSDAWYVGALGSPRTTEKRLQRLRELDIPEADLSRLHAPVGLAIGSKTPLEIAVAIMAEIIQLRRRDR